MITYVKIVDRIGLTASNIGMIAIVHALMIAKKFGLRYGLAFVTAV